MLFDGEGPTVGSLFDPEPAEPRSGQRGLEDVNRGEPPSVDVSETREGLPKDAEVPAFHVRRRNHDAARRARDLPQDVGIALQLVDDHDEERHVEAVGAERKTMRIPADAGKGRLRPGHLQHFGRRIEGHHAMGGIQEGREPTGPGTKVENPLPAPDPAEVLQAGKPEVPVHLDVRADGVVVPGARRIVNRHATCKRLPRIRLPRNRMTVAEFSITPIGKGASVGTYVARCLEIVDRSGMPYRLNAMGTIVEGEFDDILKLVARCHKAVAEDCERVSTSIKIDDRKGVTAQLEGKVKAVERHLGRKLRT